MRRELPASSEPEPSGSASDTVSKVAGWVISARPGPGSGMVVQGAVYGDVHVWQARNPAKRTATHEFSLAGEHERLDTLCPGQPFEQQGGARTAGPGGPGEVNWAEVTM